jgi:hypothetical protein
LSRLSITRKSSLLAIALGLTALGPPTIPAAARPGLSSARLPASLVPPAPSAHPAAGFIGERRMPTRASGIPAGLANKLRKVGMRIA